jgi:hypothetical protein
MNSSMFALNMAINGLVLFLIACVISARLGVPKEALGIGGALALWGWAVGAGKLFNRYAKVEA